MSEWALLTTNIGNKFGALLDFGYENEIMDSASFSEMHGLLHFKLWIQRKVLVKSQLRINSIDSWVY